MYIYAFFICVFLSEYVFLNLRVLERLLVYLYVYICVIYVYLSVHHMYTYVYEKCVSVIISVSVLVFARALFNVYCSRCGFFFKNEPKPRLTRFMPMLI